LVLAAPLAAALALAALTGCRRCAGSIESRAPV
jgi:hypothetical protein